ncbi:MAG: pyridoxal phosphate-dependent aminotransferase [Chloroflexi bacterium]|nr:pyridoxal phosphate-dependent aminotransferase [Chloroflexota bacterium]
MEALALPLAERLSQLGTESAFDVLVKAQALELAGRRIIHLEIGEPDFTTPPHIVEAAIRALHDGFTHYGPPAGLPVLREAIADHIHRTRNIPIHADQVVVTPGAKPIIFYTVLAVAQQGDEVVLPDPGFPIYASLVRFVGATPVALPLRMRDRFAFRVEDVERVVTDRTRLIILNSPHNPCGSALSPHDLKQLADFIRGKPIWVLSDEIYSRMTYGTPHASIASFDGMAEQSIILDGFSKTYAMTGWRLGYGVFPKPLVPHIVRLMINSNSCTATFTQIAGLTALTGPQDCVVTMMAEFAERRAAIVEGLRGIPGWECLMPQGAFYAFPRVAGLGGTSQELADFFLREAGVALLSGASFGAAGEGYLRLSYANDLSHLREAVHRLAEATSRWTEQQTRTTSSLG